jgi:hypothetical protein
MKQSSIDWIYNNLKSHFEHDGDLLEAVKMSFEQAKAMHKDEIENAYWDGGQWVPTSGSQCEEYYNETFNTNQENLQDSTNGYTYYPQENKTVFNTK